MNTTPWTDHPPFEAAARALLALVEADRAQQCAQIEAQARAQAAAQRAQALAAARARLRAAVAEQRRLSAEQAAAAQARLATQRRLHEQQRSAALLLLAWQQLPGALQARWQQPASRARWVAHVLASARARLGGGAWTLLHAPDWPAPERAALAPDLPPGSRFEAEAALQAGLKVALGGNIVDGTLAGLLADRAEIEAALLCLMETSA